MRRHSKRRVYSSRFLSTDSDAGTGGSPWVFYGLIAGPIATLLVGLAIQPAHHTTGGILAVVGLIVIIATWLPFIWPWQL